MTVWMNNDKSLIITKYNIIRKNDSSVPTLLYFLFPTEYHGVDLTDFSANLFYQIPNGDVYNVVLSHEAELYKDHIKLTLPSAVDFTKYAGEVMIKIVLTKVIDEVIYTLVTGECAINVQGVRDYYDDPTQGTIEHIEEEIAEINARLDQTANNISLNKITNELYLTNSGLPIGTPITMEDLGNTLVDANSEGLVKVVL